MPSEEHDERIVPQRQDLLSWPLRRLRGCGLDQALSFPNGKKMGQLPEVAGPEQLL